MPVLQTARLDLALMTDDDLDDLTGMLSDPEVMRFYPAVGDRQMARAVIARNQERYARLGFGLWTVRTRAGEFVGDCGLTVQQVDGRDEVEVGYHLRTAMQRRGYAAEAARACVRHAVDQGIERVVAIVHRDNVASQKVALRSGLHLEQEIDIAGRPHHIYATTMAPEQQRSP